VGQDVSAWGRDLPGDESLSTLVGRLADVQGLAWLRLLYIQPDGITPDLLEAMTASAVVCRYLDIPMQHASRPVLAAMGRQGRDTDYLRLLGTVRAALPGVALRSTFIAGFPGESRADYESLQRFVRTARLDYAGVFAFSSEEGTAAASLTPKVAARTVKARVQRLRDLSDEIGFELAASRIGTRVEVLVEGVDDDGYTVGRHRGQAPEVDGGVLLRGGEGIAPGTIVDAEIVEALGYDLVGEVR
jgi:ribosomal protein S12 methylthiotransferase